MASQDDLTLLKQMYQRGEISDEQYDVLRRHVLWGTPLPQLIDEVPAPRAPAPPVSAPRAPAVSAPPRAGQPRAAPPRAAPSAPPAARLRRLRRLRRLLRLLRLSGDVGGGSVRRVGRIRAGRPADRAVAAGHRLRAGAGPGALSGAGIAGRAAASRAGVVGRAAAPRAGVVGRAAPRGTPRRRGPGRSGPPSRRSPAALGLPPGRRAAHGDARPGRLPTPGLPRGRRAAHGDSLRRLFTLGLSSGRRAAQADPRSGRLPTPGLPRGRRAAHGDSLRRLFTLGLSSGRRAAQVDPRSGRLPAPGLPRGRRAAQCEPPRLRPTSGHTGRGDRPSAPAAYRSGGGRPQPDRGDAYHRLDEPPAPSGAYRGEAEPTSPYRPDGETPGLGRGASARHPELAPEHSEVADPAPRRRRREAADPSDRPPPAPKRRGRGLFAVLTSVLLALALIAAGVWWFALRETGVDAQTYARSICGSVRDWQRGVDAASSALVKTIPREQDRTKVRTAVQRYYTDLATRTDGLRGAIDAAGPVDVAGGQAYADSLTAAVGDQSAALRELADRAGRLDVAAATVFQISLQSLLTGAESAVSEVTAALARPAAGTPAALRLALSDEPACAPYVG